MKKILYIICVIFYFHTTYGANLNDKVDQLSPENAEKFIKTPIAKSLYPFPEGLIKNLGFGISRTIYSTQETNIQHLIDNSMTPPDTYWGTSKFISFKYNEKIRLGLSFFNADKNSNSNYNETTGRLQRHYSKLSQILFYGSYVIYKEKNMKITTQAGLGIANTFHSIHHINSEENAENTPEIYQEFEGNSYIYQLGISASYMLNPVWEFGLNVNYTNGKVESHDSLTQKNIANSHYDLSGTQFNIFTGRTIF